MHCNEKFTKNLLFSKVYQTRSKSVLISNYKCKKKLIFDKFRVIENHCRRNIITGTTVVRTDSLPVAKNLERAWHDSTPVSKVALARKSEP